MTGTEPIAPAAPDDEPVDGPVAAEPRRSRLRTAAVVVAGVMAVLTLVLAGTAVWAGRTVLDSDRMATYVADAVAEPDVADALATRVVDEIGDAINLRDRVLEVTPDALDARVELLLAGVRALVADQVSDFVQSDTGRGIVERSVEVAHRRLVRVLRGDGLVDGISVEDGVVTWNALPLVARGLGVLADLGIVDADVPELDRAGDPDEQRAALEDALGRDLPEDFGEVEVYRTDAASDAGATVEQAQRLFVVARRLVWLLLILGLALAALTIWLARRRAVAAAAVGGGVVAGLVLVRWFAGEAAARAPEAVASSGARRAVEEVLGDLVRSLTRWTLLYVLVVLAVVVLAIVADRRARTATTPHTTPDTTPDTTRGTTPDAAPGTSPDATATP